MSLSNRTVNYFYIISVSAVLLTISYAAAQSQQGHPWTEITLPSSPNVWTGLNADMLDGLHYADFSARLWSGYDPSTDNIWYNDGGNVGIGTTAPSQKLDVSGNIRASGSLTGSQVCIGTDCINSWSDVRDTDWTESGGNVYRASGNVGIGTASPSYKLDVSGTIRATGDVRGNRLCIDSSCRSSWPSGGDTDWTESGGNVYRASGNVGIGTSNPQAKLEVAGKILTDPTTDSDPDNTVVTKSYVKSQTTYDNCAWYNGQQCPVRDGIQTLQAGITEVSLGITAQVYCCGKTAISCTPYGWTTYDQYCRISSNCECGSGYTYYRQRRRLSNCKIEYRVINSGNRCSVGCSFEESCVRCHCEPIDTCFIAGTKITMADGTKKNIEDVKIGEKLLGANGKINTVIDYDRTIIGNRGTYILNNKTEFTGDHPFLTEDGWKVADSKLFYTTHKNTCIHPTQLKIGDVLITENGKEIVKSLEKNNQRPVNETVYDFVLDGDHTFIANGFVVHNCDCAFVFSEKDGKKYFEWLLFGIYEERGNYTTKLIDARNWRGNEGYTYLDIQHETNKFELVELPYEIDHIDFLQLQVTDTLLPEYSYLKATLPERITYNLSLVNASRGLELMKYPDNRFFDLKSKERVEITFENIPKKDSRYRREIEMVAKGYYNFFKETRLKLDYAPYNQTKWLEWLEKPESKEQLREVYSRNIRQMNVPYIPSYSEGVEFYNKYYTGNN